MTAKEALEFYAQCHNWKDYMPGWNAQSAAAISDRGDIARQALSQLKPQTDLDALMQLVNSLQLDERKLDRFSPDSEEYKVSDTAGTVSVELGSGEGYSGFVAEFKFDEAGKIISHSVWE